MKIRKVRLFQGIDESFILYHETKKFHEFHHHPEFELVLITSGKGIRMVGDHIERFEENDLVLLGSFLPHEWRCDEEFVAGTGKFLGEGIVIQFLTDSFGGNFFDLPENISLKRVLSKAAQGLKILGVSRKRITAVMKQMLTMDGRERLYALFTIFSQLSDMREYEVLSSPSFLHSFNTNESEPLQKAVQHILQNFRNDIKISDLLEITNMSNTTFFLTFKKMYGMTFKRFLLSIKIGYACRLLGEDSMNISQIAYESGFENLSNFNRQFKAHKGCTPRAFKDLIQGKLGIELEVH